MTIPAYIRKAMEALAQAGFDSYIVGGAVRDTLRGVSVHDYDITTPAIPDQVTFIMERAGFKKIIDTSAKYGTVVFIDPEHISQKVEITTYRSDVGYTDGRHPDEVHFTSSLEEDAARRDFTINSLYMDMNGDIVDPNGGKADIKNCVIRAVGDPSLRFQEDALRILRAVRFEAQTGFTIDPETSAAMKENAHLLKNISAERIYSEFTRTVTAVNGPAAIKNNIEVVGQIIPELLLQKDFDQKTKYHDRDLLTHTLDVLAGIPLTDDGVKDTALAYGALFHDIGKPEVFTIDEDGVGHMKTHAIAGVKITERIADDLKFPNQLRHEVTELVLYHDSYPPADKKSVKLFVSMFGFELSEKIFELMRADTAAHSPLGLTRLNVVKSIVVIYKQIREENPCMTIRQLAITGDDLLALGYPEGPLIGKILKDVLEKVITETIANEREDIFEYVKGAFEM